MEYKEIIKILKNYKKIVVTGPQRSGTRIASNIIAKDLNYKYFDEKDFSITDYGKFLDIIKEDNISIHCPALSDRILDFPDDIFIVFMRRNIDDIIRSQNRIGWNVRGKDLHESGIREYNVYKKFEEYFDRKRPIAEIKYDVWDNYQKTKINNWIDLDYESLKESNLWKNKNDRKGYEWNQIK